MLNRRTLLVVASLAMLSSGCAAIFKGSKQTVRFEAIPGESDVRSDGRFLGETPTEAKIDRDRPPNVAVSKDGFKEQHVQLQKKADTPWFFWDIATCVIPVTLCIPVLVDAISGAWYSYDDVYVVKLDPLPYTPTATPRPGSAPTAAPAANTSPELTP